MILFLKLASFPCCLQERNYISTATSASISSHCHPSKLVGLCPLGPVMEEGQETCGTWLASTVKAFLDTWILSWARGQVGSSGASTTIRTWPHIASWLRWWSTLVGYIRRVCYPPNWGESGSIRRAMMMWMRKKPGCIGFTSGWEPKRTKVGYSFRNLALEGPGEVAEVRKGCSVK